ncbi:MAG TPA: helix-turn-helix domain-containing protein [Thermoleophilaceae bacterium]|nr:helix-turn-helix domain-containing protein [Thermoleophilaceae bacterium]
MSQKATTSRASRARSDSRSSSDERREQVLEAAVKEFAANGYHAASTSAIAKRAGISQPYIYALFPSKRELFLATHRRVTLRILETFADAARGKDGPDAKLEAMGKAYMQLLEDRDEILVQMQAHAAAGDPDLREPIRDAFMDVIQQVRSLTGASEERVLDFMSKGMYLNVAAALDLPREYC